MISDSHVCARQVMVVIALSLSAAVVGEVSDGAHQTTDIDRSQSKASVRQKTTHHHAALWELTEVEWTRYQTLMQGIRGSISPKTLSPIEVLGIHARNAEERTRFAERWAMMMREDAERILAFQHAYDAAQRRLFPAGQLIDSAKFPLPVDGPNTLKKSDRILFFTRLTCAACDALFDQLLAKLDRIAGIDVYLLTSSLDNQETIRTWARARNIDLERVRRRDITLNSDAGVLSRLSDKPNELPQMMRRRGDEVVRLRSLVW